MEQSARIKMIEDSIPTGEIKSITYDGQNLILPVKEIPLEALIYNPYNGRISSLVKSFESARESKIDAEDKNDIKVIEQYLYDSAKGRNEKTEESLQDIGQQEIGIITKDGVVIDGNRRTMLLKKIQKSNPDFKFFKAITLPDELNVQESREKIVLLETRYQMGVDSKVDYNPIEKYLRCSELKYTFNLDIGHIANVMAETDAQISEWLKILELMESYLQYLGTPKIYTRLEKREGHFVDLKNYLKGYESRKHRNVNWHYTDSDLLDLRNAYFDYIRLGIPVIRARIIAKPSGGISFFCKREIWEDFILENKRLKADIVEEKFSVLRAEFPGKTNENIISYLDKEWLLQAESSLIQNLSFNESNLKDIVETYTPLKLLRRILNNLGQINTDNVEQTTLPEVNELIVRIQDKVASLKERLNN